MSELLFRPNIGAVFLLKRRPNWDYVIKQACYIKTSPCRSSGLLTLFSHDVNPAQFPGISERDSWSAWCQWNRFISKFFCFLLLSPSHRRSIHITAPRGVWQPWPSNSLSYPGYWVRGFVCDPTLGCFRSESGFYLNNYTVSKMFSGLSELCLFRCSWRSSVSEEQLLAPSVSVCLSRLSCGVGNLHGRGSSLENIVKQLSGITLVRQCHMWSDVKKTFEMFVYSREYSLVFKFF
jgi:hypothetical protein